MSAVAHQGLGTLQQAKLEEFKKQAVLAAEAGAVDAMEQMVDNPGLDGSFPEVDMGIGATYSFVVFNNLTGGGPIVASNGAEVPGGCAYILSTGEMGTISREAGVMVSPGAASALGIAIGVGGLIDMSGSKRVTGTVKANGSIKFSGSSRIEPIDGSGQLLSSSSISVSGSTRVDDTQDVLARSGISGSIRGGYTIDGSDSSVATEPFINDYRTTNALLPGEKGSVLPNPDPAVLLAGAVIHTETDPSDLDLGGNVHFFPYGANFSGSTNITGPGTIVVGGGHPMSFSGSSRIAEVNLIAIRGTTVDADGNPYPEQFPPNASISFSGSSRITGLIYAHDGIDDSGSLRVEGLVIAYDSVNGNLNTSGSSRIELDSTVLADIPGFEPWADGFGGEGGIPAGTGSIGVISWERL
ncbi:MAG: hypothetical protein KC800_25675 [Candidatus Eremiobacteraeota bacterium]|nr:hypothetical protein [Candidatus Eremiobacteraeota bacterium]